MQQKFWFLILSHKYLSSFPSSMWFFLHIFLSGLKNTHPLELCIENDLLRTRNGEEVQWRKNEGRKGLKNKQVATARSFAPREAQVQQKVSRGSGLSVPSWGRDQRHPMRYQDSSQHQDLTRVTCWDTRPWQEDSPHQPDWKIKQAGSKSFSN